MYNKLLDVGKEGKTYKFKLEGDDSQDIFVNQKMSIKNDILNVYDGVDISTSDKIKKAVAPDLIETIMGIMKDNAK